PCPYPNVHREWLTQRIHDNTVPPVDVHVQDISNVLSRITGVSNVNAFAVRIEKSKRPGGHQTVSGLAKIRDGNRCLPFYFAEDDRTKACVPGAAASDLALTSIEWGIEQYRRKFKLPSDAWGSPYDFLFEVGLIEKFHPLDDPSATSCRVSLAGLLLFGKQAAIKQYSPSSETLVITPHKDYRYSSNLVETYKELCGTRNGLLFSLCPNIPTQIIKELATNAFIHRSYREAAPIKISVSESQLRIESPGELPGQLSPDMLIHCTPV